MISIFFTGASAIKLGNSQGFSGMGCLQIFLVKGKHHRGGGVHYSAPPRILGLSWYNLKNPVKFRRTGTGFYAESYIINLVHSYYLHWIMYSRSNKNTPTYILYTRKDGTFLTIKVYFIGIQPRKFLTVWNFFLLSLSNENKLIAFRINTQSKN